MGLGAEQVVKVDFRDNVFINKMKEAFKTEFTKKENWSKTALRSVDKICEDFLDRENEKRVIYEVEKYVKRIKLYICDCGNYTSRPAHGGRWRCPTQKCGSTRKGWYAMMEMRK